MEEITKTQYTVDQLREEIHKKSVIDVSPNMAAHLRISDTTLRRVLAILKDEHFVVHEFKVSQIGSKRKAFMRVLCVPGTTLEQAKEKLGIK